MDHLLLLFLHVQEECQENARDFILVLENLFQKRRKIEKSVMMGWLKAKFSFNLLRSANVCIRGYRSLKNVDNSDVSNTDIIFVNDICIH